MLPVIFLGAFEVSSIIQKHEEIEGSLAAYVVLVTLLLNFG